MNWVTASSLGGQGARFDHPQLDEAANERVGRLLAMGSGGKLWSESFADAYAALWLLRRAKRDGQGRESAMQALEWVWAMREKERRAFEDAEKKKGKLGFGLGFKHATGETLRILKEDTQVWVDADCDEMGGAAKLASMGGFQQPMVELGSRWW